MPIKSIVIIREEEPDFSDGATRYKQVKEGGKNMMDYMAMIKETAERDKFLAKQEADRKAYEYEVAMRKAYQRLDEVKDDVCLVIQVLQEIAKTDEKKLSIPFDTMGNEYNYRSYSCHYDGSDCFYFGAAKAPRNPVGTGLHCEVNVLGWYWEKRVYGDTECYSYAYDGKNFYYQEHGPFGLVFPRKLTPDIIYDFCDKFIDYKARFDKWFKENFTV